jgi:hypothetical protein
VGAHQPRLENIHRRRRLGHGDPNMARQAISGKG